MLLVPANFLILDEPTNHLDMRSKGVLQDALQNYEGTLVIVSHDRSFLDPLITKVLEFSPGGMRVYLGTVSEYLQKKSEERERRAQAERPAEEAKNDEKLSAKDRRRREAELRLERSKRVKPIKDRIGRLEKTIAQLEQRKKDLERLMADPEFFSQGEDARRAPAEYRKIESDLAYAYREWEELAEQLAGGD
jgi:ATP-binding cassette subfamily F protein 3